MTDTSKPPNFESGSSSQQNFVSLKEYFERRLFDMERSTQISLRNSEIAIDKAEQATNYRLALLNESRDSLRDQTRLYVTKAEFDSLQKVVYALAGGLAVVQALLQVFAN